MASVNNERHEFTQTTTSYTKPKTVYVNSDELIETYQDYINPEHSEIRATQLIEQRQVHYIDHDGTIKKVTVWNDHRIVEIINPEKSDLPLADYHDPISDEPFFSSSDVAIANKKAYKSEIRKVLNYLIHEDFKYLNNEFYEQNRICQGHLIQEKELKGSGKNKQAQELSDFYILKYETLPSQLAGLPSIYKRCITTTTGLKNKNEKPRFYAHGYHGVNDQTCNHYAMQFFPILEHGEVSSTPIPGENMVKKCLGHSEHLHTFPANSSGDEALRNYSDQELAKYQAEQNLKNQGRGSLATHRIKRKADLGSWQDLWIFYQHADNHENCSRSCYVPQVIIQDAHSRDILATIERELNLIHNSFGDAPIEKCLQYKEDLDQVLTLDPQNYSVYLARSQINTHLEDYKAAIRDFKNFDEIAPKPTNTELTQEFCAGFCSGFKEGVKDSLTNWKHLLVDFTKHPIRSLDLMCDALRDLTHLSLAGAWDQVAEALLPEVTEMITQWPTLSSQERGILWGKTSGRIGVDLGIPAGINKLASKGAKEASKLTKAANKLKKADNTLTLETAAATGAEAKAAELIQKNQKLATAAQETGLSTRQMFQLKQEGKLDGSLLDAYRNIFPSEAALESFECFERAQQFLKPYRNKFMPENQIRALIKEAGIEMPSRPKGIPENYKTCMAKGIGGIKYVNPNNSQDIIRVMPGKLHSPLPLQQKPYVIQQKNGKAFDIHGNLIKPDAPNAHVPFEKFKYR